MSVRKIEFLMCGSPNDAFFSQAAMFRIGLDAIGGIYREARLVLSLDQGAEDPLPARWQPYFERIELYYAPLDHFTGEGPDRIEFGDSRLHSYSLLDASADLSVICDADTLLLRAFPQPLLEELYERQELGAVIAHRPPQKTDVHARDLSTLSNEAFWDGLSMHVLGRTVELPHRYKLASTDQHCPFYINYGLVIARPHLLARFHRELVALEPRVREYLDNVFYSQLAVPMAIENGGLTARSLPIRYNYPNDPIADSLYPEDRSDIYLLHFQMRHSFDRHRIFVDAEQFAAFMALRLEGSSRIFQDHVRQLTDGCYPF
jgi:hypothetical protein